MVKVKKENIIYTIPDSQLERFIGKGFSLVIEDAQVEIVETEELEKEEPTLEPVEEKEEDIEKPITKSIWQMTKAELTELAISKGINVTGDEKINDLRSKLK